MDNFLPDYPVAAIHLAAVFLSNVPFIYGMLACPVFVVNSLTPGPSEVRIRAWERRMVGTARKLVRLEET